VSCSTRRWDGRAGGVTESGASRGGVQARERDVWKKENLVCRGRLGMYGAGLTKMWHGYDDLQEA
jgi:hypothetical protein